MSEKGNITGVSYK